MRPYLLYAFLGFASASFAQFERNTELNTLPAWMQQVITGERPLKYVLPKKAPLHTNAFTGSWVIQKKNGRRYSFWSDKHRVVIHEFDNKGKLVEYHFIDLAANLHMSASSHTDGNFFHIDDLHVPQVGYFRDLWNDSVHATGRSEMMLGNRCAELRGIDSNKDTTYYWSTKAHPRLFADLQVWAAWLCREGELRFLSALSDRNAGGSLRVDWPARRYGPEAGSIAFVSITPGATPMPTLEHKPYQVFERRFQWMNNTGIGRLPAWMRSYLTTLPPDPLPLAFTPDPAERNIPDNAFIGTLTAETPTMQIDGNKDTTMRVAKYSYWADARRAVLRLDDPEEEGIVTYLVDLDADVAIAAVNEGHSHVVPKLYIGDLEGTGLDEFGRGLEFEFQPQGRYKTILGRKCELNITTERFLQVFLFPKDSVVNPVFDMKNWLDKQMAQHVMDLMFFGVADMPMPMAVMGTHLTSYKPGKAKPPVLDMSNYQVRDQRIRERRDRARDRYDEETVQVKEITLGDDDMGNVTQEPGYDVAVPPDEKMAVQGGDPEKNTPLQEGRMEDLVSDVPEPAVVEVEIGPESMGSEVADITPITLSPFLENVIARPTNRFIGTATLLFKRVYHGSTTTWTVKYASTADRSILISTSSESLPSVRTVAIATHRKAGDEVRYQLMPDSSIKAFPSQLRTAFVSPAVQVLLDSTNGSSRTILERSCEHRVHQSTGFRRDAWVDPKTPSIFMDLFGARKGWDGIDHILHGHHLAIAVEGMPLTEDLFHMTHDQINLRVVELKPGPVDPEVFRITKDSWR